jgi:tRNA U55 pseudouridine synthase TruB
MRRTPATAWARRFLAQPGTRKRRWPAEEIEAALASLRGYIDQIPPMYSAKKIGGKKLYELARRG